MYIWNKQGWPGFHWYDVYLSSLIARVAREQGRLLGKMEAPGYQARVPPRPDVNSGGVQGLDSSHIAFEFLRRIPQIHSSLRIQPKFRGVSKKSAQP